MMISFKRVARPTSHLLPYVVALGSVGLALLLSLLLSPLITPNPFLLFFGAVALSARFGGLRGSLSATALAVVCVGVFLIPPYGTLAITLTDLARLLGFVLVAGLISLLSERMRRAQIAAQAQAELLAVTLRSIGDGVITTDAQGRITMLNAVAERLTGWSSAEAQGQPARNVFTIVNEQRRQPVENPLERVLREGVVVGLDNHTLLLTRDGAERPIDDSGAPIRDAQGRIIGAVLVFRDVTERYRIEQERLRMIEQIRAAQQHAEQERQRLAEVIAQAPALMAVVRGPQHRFESANSAYSRIASRSPDELIGRSFGEIFANPDAQDFETLLDRAYASGQVLTSSEVSLRYHDAGRLVEGCYTFVYQPLRSEQGQIEGLLIHGIDISEEVQARATIQQSAERTARLQSITAALSQALTPMQVASAVVEQCMADMSAEWGALALLQEDGETVELIYTANYPERLLDHFRTFPLSAKLPFAEVIRNRSMLCLEGRDERAGRYPSLAHVTDIDGPRASISVPLLVDGRAIGALGVTFPAPHRFSDTDRALMQTLGHLSAQAIARARLYAAEQAARAEAETAVRLRDMFLSVASHELKTPLTSLLMQTQLLQRRALREHSLSERDQRGLQVIADQARRLDRMISTILDISRLERGQFSIVSAPVDLDALLQRVIAEIQPTAEHHPMLYSGPGAPALIEGDDLRLEQVLQNILQNAIKYSPDGGPIQVRLEQRPEEVLLSISDNGIGIPQAALDQLFTRFYRASNADPRQISGMGIGLYVVKEIVTLHGGTVSVSSTEGQGSTFTIRLPLQAQPHSEEVHP